MLRRSLLLMLAAALVAGLAGTAQAGAKPRKSSPRLHAFASCSNLLGYAQRNSLRVIRDTPVFVGGGGGGGVPIGGPVMPESGAGEGGGGVAPVAAPQPAPAPGARDGDSTSQTNVQEAGVDEPDWVKAVGTKLYVARNGRLFAIDASASPALQLGSIELPGGSHELLIRGDRALVISSLGFAGGGPVAIADQVGTVAPSEWLGRTRLIEIDISDPAAMRVLRTLDVEGSYLSARLTGATARVVIRTEARGIEMPPIQPDSRPAEVRRDWRRAVRRTRTRAWLPSSVLRDRRTGRTRRRAAVRCRQVRRTQSFSGLGTMTVLTIDMDRGLPAVDADSLMTDGDTVYASPDRLYVASRRWLGVDPTRREILDEAATGLHAFSTTRAGETSYVGSGEVPGYLLNQWSLSEHEGILRAATTSMPPWNTGARSSSAVRTLEERDGRLVEIGRVSGLGEGERIYAVRYIGDVGFVVTFRQTDPLYTVDLSNPRAPRVVGELKVPGYSAYLHPVGDGLLLGVGQDATEEGRRTGVQVSLFDVSDLANPQRLDVFALGGSSFTDVEHDHRAFLWWEPLKLAVIPVFQYADDFDGLSFGGALGFGVDRAGGVSERARIAHPGSRTDFAAFERSVVVGDRLLLLSGAGVLSTPLARPGSGGFTAYQR